jgi:hypothetical protein
LAERARKADAAGLDALRGELKSLRADIARVRLALMDRLSREQMETTKHPTDPTPEGAKAERGRAFTRGVLAQVDELDGHCRHVLSTDTALRTSAVTRLLRLTGGTEPAATERDLPAATPAARIAPPSRAQAMLDNRPSLSPL